MEQVARPRIEIRSTFKSPASSVSDLVLGIFAGVGFDAVGVASRLAEGAPLKRVLPIVMDFGVALEGAIVCK